MGVIMENINITLLILCFSFLMWIADIIGCGICKLKLDYNKWIVYLLFAISFILASK